MELRERSIAGYRYAVAVCGGRTALIDTVPAAYADAWLRAAGRPDFLILCGVNPFPRSVERFAEAFPAAKIVATPYILYTLTGILCRELNGIAVHNGTSVPLGKERITLRTTCVPGQPAYLTAYSGEEILWTGQREETDAAEGFAAPTVVIPYVSGCDYTETLAELIAEGVRDAGGLEAKLCDLNSSGRDEVLWALKNADGVLVGTPTVHGEAPRKVWDLLTEMRGEQFAGKPAAAFGSYVWSGAGVEHVTQRLRQLGMKVADDGYAVQFRPDEAARKGAYEYGYNFACVVQNKANLRKSRLVKCLVCGEIFDASLGHCPVCGVGPDKCVPVEEELVAYRCDTQRRYVILGGGPAALSAADAIRKRDQTGRVLMLSAEEQLPFNRPMLTKNMATAALLPEKLAVKDPGWYAENNIEVRLGCRVSSLDLEHKKLVTAAGETLCYDKLIYALGAECSIPAIEGREKRGVYSIRSQSDVKAIWDDVTAARNVAVIGGGVLGLEAASELRKARRAVTVLEMAPKLMGRQLDDRTAERLAAACEAFKVRVMTGVRIAAIEGGERVTGVRLAGGQVIPADIVVISCGNRAVTNLAAEAGIACGRGVIVDETMATSAPDVYACGDCAEYDGVNYQLWPEALEQGRVAGANAAGENLAFRNVPLGMSFEGMNTQLFSIGDIGTGGLDYKTVESADELGGSGSKLWFADGKLCGAVLYKDTKDLQKLSEALARGASYSDVMQ